MMHKLDRKQDRRIKRTEKLIFDALIAVTIQKGFSDVTVSDITYQAGINRTTFYRHYTDKFDLVNQYTKSVYAMLDSTLRKADVHQIQPSLVKIFDHVRENALFYQVMLGKHGNPDFTEKIRMYIQKRIRGSLPYNLKADKRKIALFVTYSAHASLGAVLWWLEHDMPYSSEEIITILGKLEATNLQTLLA